MQDPRTLKAFRLSGTLNLHVYRITETLPADADPEWIAGLRSAASALAQQVLRGCGSRGLTAELALRDALDELDQVGGWVEKGEQMGYLGPDGVLELLELQTALLMQLILVNQGVPQMGRMRKTRETQEAVPPSLKVA